MNHRLARSFALILVGIAGFALAKLPPPSEEAKAKTAEAAAKAAWGSKVADFQLCNSMDRIAARYASSVRSSGTAPLAPIETPACADPGSYIAAGAASAPQTPVLAK